MDNEQFTSLSSQPKISSLPGVGDLLNRTWQIYKERIWVFLGIMILPVLIALVIALLFGGLFILQIKNFFQLGLSSLPILVILILITIIIFLWSRVALLFSIKEREARIGIRDSFARGWSKIISYFWISILVGFITVIGFLLFIIPGIIFSIWFSLATYVLVAEGSTGRRALSRSKQLVSGFWWKVLWRFLVIGIIALIISFIISLFEGLIGIPKEIDISSIAISLFFTPFAAVYSFLIYEELKKIKEEMVV